MKAFLAGDFTEYDRLTSRMNESGWDGYQYLLGAVFLEAIDRRFATGYTRADITGLVADARRRFDKSGTVLDLGAAERLVLAALGEGLVDDLNDRIRAQTQILILGELVTKEQRPDADLDDLLNCATDLANEHIRRSECR